MPVKLTVKGEELLQKLQAGEIGELRFTDMALGNGSWNPEDLTANVSELKNIRLKQPVATKYAEKKGDKTFIFLSSTFSNRDVAETFYVYEVGLYALDGETEILYAYEIMPAGTPAQAVIQDQSIPQFIPVSIDIGISNIDAVNLTLTADFSVVSAEQLRGHTDDRENPHGVTKAQVGLGNCDNTNDMEKPISTAVRLALAEKQPAGDYVTNADMLSALESKQPVGDYAFASDVAGKADAVHEHGLADSQLTGILPVAKGGTGGADVPAALQNLLKAQSIPIYDDLNLVPGDYSGPFRWSLDALNQPPGNYVGIGWQYSYSGNIVKQMTFRTYGVSPYVRQQVNGEYTPWKKMFTEEDVVPIVNGGTGASNIIGAANSLKVMRYSGWKAEWNNDANLIDESCVLRVQFTANVPLGANYGQLLTIYDGSSDTKAQIYISVSGVLHYRGCAGTTWSQWHTPDTGGIQPPDSSKWIRINEGESFTLPTGGSWAYFYLSVAVDGSVRTSFADVAAGGTTLKGDTTFPYTKGFAWRVA